MKLKVLAFVGAIALGVVASAQPVPKKSTPGVRYRLARTAQGRDVETLDLDLEKHGRKSRYVLFWDGKDDQDEKGRLHLIEETTNPSYFMVSDDFDIGFRPKAETSFYELSGHNVLVIHQQGVGSPGGDTYRIFSSEDGRLYQVQFIGLKSAKPAIFTEHYSVGYPFAIRFLDDGATIRTLETTQDPVPKGKEGEAASSNMQKVTTYSWDGSSYREIKKVMCVFKDCHWDAKD